MIVTGEQLQKKSGAVRAEARRRPVTVTYHGRPELVILSVEEYELLRSKRKLAYGAAELPTETAARIADSRMERRHDYLDGLMDD